MKRTTLRTLELLACLTALSTAHAGPGAAPAASGSGTTVPPPPPSEEQKALELEWSAGYDSHYIFRGELLQKNTPWTQIEANIALTDALSLTLTPWFLIDADDDYTEFDLVASVNYSLHDWELSLGYQGYYYPRKSLGGGEGIGDEQEMTFGVSRDVGPLSVSFLTAYSFTRDGFYYELGVTLPYEINDTFGVAATVVLGWDTDYFAKGTGFNHVETRLSFPVNLTDNITLTPYVAGNFPFDQLDYADSDVFGGVSLSIGF